MTLVIVKVLPKKWSIEFNLFTLMRYLFNSGVVPESSLEGTPSEAFVQLLASLRREGNLSATLWIAG